MFKELQELGLSEKEARVYLAALEIGPATADQLAKQAKIKRPTTYVQLESLMKTGLMSTYEEDKKTYFAPESPELLTRLLEKQKENLVGKEQGLQKFLPELLRQFESAGERPVVRFFPGKEGIHALREEALKTKEKKIYSIFSPSHMAEIFSAKDLDAYTDRRKALQIYSKGIYLHESWFDRAGLDELTERRFIPPSVLPMTIDIRIYDDSTAIFSLKGDLFAMEVKSKQISESMKMIFELLWSQAQTHSAEK
jgi:sugar-specific transcriptional regulator TrmB